MVRDCARHPRRLQVGLRGLVASSGPLGFPGVGEPPAGKSPAGACDNPIREGATPPPSGLGGLARPLARGRRGSLAFGQAQARATASFPRRPPKGG
ncbi:hypothetical protein NL676_016106 [Syzygium grande]|nr:hypothetical protein NL676_016106 [Syzygium grande]